MVKKNKVTIRDLVTGGLLRANEELVMHLGRSGKVVTGTVTREGTIRFPDGRQFDTPSGAATAARGTIVNGWTVWRTAREGKSLDDIRRQLR